MTSTSTSPVLLLIGSESMQTRAAIEALAAYKPKQLFVAGDHPNLRRSTEAERCQGARNQLELISWPCEITAMFPPVHRGRNAFIEQAISWFFEKNAEGIIVEDCCAPTPDFFDFADQMLATYRSVAAAQQISGSNLIPSRKHAASYYFTKYSHCFAWATWKRAWEGFQALRETPQSSVISRACTDHEEAGVWAHVLRTEGGRTPAWEVRWNYYIWSTNGLCIAPSANLVQHLDYRAAPEHFPLNKLRALAVGELQELSHPQSLLLDDESDRLTFVEYYSRSAKDLDEQSIVQPPEEPVETRQIELTEEAVPESEEQEPTVPPLDVSGLYERAQALKRMARIEEAIFTLEFLLSTGPGHCQAEALLVELKSLREPAAKTEASQAFAEHEPEPIASKVNRLIDLALDSMERNENEPALKFMEEALEVNFTVRDLQHVYAMTLIKFDRLKEAKEALEAELNRYPDNRAAEELLDQVVAALADEEQELQKKAAAEEAQRLAEEEEKRRIAEAEEQRRIAAAEEEQRRRLAEAEEERKRLAAEEAERLKAVQAEQEEQARLAAAESAKAAEPISPRSASMIVLPPEPASVISLPVEPAQTAAAEADAEGAVNTLIDEAIEALMHSQGDKALELMLNAESLNYPVRDLFHVKGLSLIQVGRELEARAALETELALFPDNRSAEDLLSQLIAQLDG